MPQFLDVSLNGHEPGEQELLFLEDGLHADVVGGVLLLQVHFALAEDLVVVDGGSELQLYRFNQSQ